MTTNRRQRLRRADCAAAGIRRVGRGRGFSYEDPEGRKVEDEETLTRIRELAIPPAWREVWICADPLGAGPEFSAKDFRTWHGTVLAALALAGEPAPDSQAAGKRTVNRAVKEVSEALGNTPAVCRRSYIDPRVFDRYRDGETLAVELGHGRVGERRRARIEAAVLALID